MTVSDLLDQIAGNAGDSSAAFRSDARRWLNLARSQIASEAVWKWAMRPVVTITTAAATTSGLYTLVDGGTSYEFIAGDTLYDETNQTNIRHESYGSTRQIDQDKSTTGEPTWWSDAGQDGNGNRQIYLWPVPDGAYTITFPAYLLLTDLTSTDDSLSDDPFFGPIISWGSVFVAGMRFYHDLDNAESDSAIVLSERRFKRLLDQKKSQNQVSSTASMKAKVVRTQNIGAAMGRLDPGSYDNRGRIF